jgi:hypothetical protein
MFRIEPIAEAQGFAAVEACIEPASAKLRGIPGVQLSEKILLRAQSDETRGGRYRRERHDWSGDRRVSGHDKRGRMAA